jgi:hypothetical protein
MIFGARATRELCAAGNSDRLSRFEGERRFRNCCGRARHRPYPPNRSAIVDSGADVLRVLREGFAWRVQNSAGARDLESFASRCFRAEVASCCLQASFEMRGALGNPNVRAKFGIMRGAFGQLARNSRRLSESVRAQLR